MSFQSKTLILRKLPLTFFYTKSIRTFIFKKVLIHDLTSDTNLKQCKSFKSLFSKYFSKKVSEKFLLSGVDVDLFLFEVFYF